MIDTVLHGDALAVLKTLPDNSVDSIVLNLGNGETKE